MLIQTQTGPATSSKGAASNFRGGQLGDGIVSELHGRFYEQTYNGNVYSTGMQLTSISNATFTTATGLSGTLATAATATPIIGLWNPPSSTVNAVILQATMGVVVTALQATGCGGFVWGSYAGINNLTSGGLSAPLNAKNFTSSGAYARGVFNVALTGLSVVGFFLRASALQGGSALNIAVLQTAAGILTQQEATTENLDGSIIVAPGAILALFCGTTPVAHSVCSSLTWEEVPI